jgi:hypothetical protein
MRFFAATAFRDAMQAVLPAKITLAFDRKITILE